MSMLSKHIPFVNEQIAFHEKMVEKYSSGKLQSEYRQKLHIATRDKLTELSSDLIKADAELDSPKLSGETTSKAPKQLSLTLSLEDIDGLPDDLIKELSFSDADKTEFAILSIIEEAGGIISLDKLLIGLFKKTGEIVKRTALTSRLYRMSQKGIVYNVPIKKGVYSTTELSEEEAKALIV